MRGGARTGAGRKKTGKHTVNFWVSDAEERALRKYLEELRVKDSGAKKPSFEEVLESMGQTTVFDYTSISIDQESIDKK